MSSCSHTLAIKLKFCGKLRFPTYPEANGWRCPGVRAWSNPTQHRSLARVCHQLSILFLEVEWDHRMTCRGHGILPRTTVHIHTGGLGYHVRGHLLHDSRMWRAPCIAGGMHGEGAALRFMLR